MPKKSGGRSSHRSGSAIASWVFGSILLFVLVAVLFLLPEPTESQKDLTRFIMALTAGFLSYFFLGQVVLKGTFLGQALGATGGFVLFILIQFVADPFSLRTAVADVAPSLSRSDPDVASAQRELAQRGLYTGPITGKADTLTREAIQKFQVSKDLKATGFLLDNTRVQLLGRRPPSP